MITFSWQVTPEQAWPNIAQRQVDAIERDLVALCEGMAPDIAAWMKANHVWENQTGAAEAGLHTELVHITQAFVGVLMSHGADVPYAYWLEVIQRGKFGIIAPALDVFGPKLVSEARAIVRRHSS